MSSFQISSYLIGITDFLFLFFFYPCFIWIGMSVKSTSCDWSMCHLCLSHLSFSPRHLSLLRSCFPVPLAVSLVFSERPGGLSCTAFRSGFCRWHHRGFVRAASLSSVLETRSWIRRLGRSHVWVVCLFRQDYFIDGVIFYQEARHVCVAFSLMILGAIYAQRLDSLAYRAVIY